MSARVEVWHADAASETLLASALGPHAGWSRRELGRVVTDHRSSWVRRVEAGTNCFYVKTYDYARLRDRWRGVARTTWLAPSRAARERDALQWLIAHGFPGPRPLALLEARGLAFLRRAVLVTEAWDGLRLDHLLPQLAPRQRDACLRELSRFVHRLHAAGFRDRNLDLRNVLGRTAGDGFVLAKIDSPRYRLASPGVQVDRWVQADRMRLAASLATLGLELPEVALDTRQRADA